MLPEVDEEYRQRIVDLVEKYEDVHNLTIDWDLLTKICDCRGNVVLGDFLRPVRFLLDNLVAETGISYEELYVCACNRHQATTDEDNQSNRLCNGVNKYPGGETEELMTLFM